MSKTHGQLAAEALLGEVVWEEGRRSKGRCECQANHQHGWTDGIKYPATVTLHPIKLFCPHHQCTHDKNYITRSVQGALYRKIKELGKLAYETAGEVAEDAPV